MQRDEHVPQIAYEVLARVRLERRLLRHEVLARNHALLHALDTRHNITDLFEVGGAAPDAHFVWNLRCCCGIEGEDGEAGDRLPDVRLGCEGDFLLWGAVWCEFVARDVVAHCNRSDRG